MSQHAPDDDGQVVEKTAEKVKKPDLYRVILHNDHYTTQEFVIEVLTTVFQKPRPIAVKIMLDVHQKGVGQVGTFTFDIATSKVAQVKKLAKANGFPLKCTIEPA